MKSLEVYLSPLAEQKLFSLLEYLEAHWGLRSKINLSKSLRNQFQSFQSSLKVQ